MPKTCRIDLSLGGKDGSRSDHNSMLPYLKREMLARAGVTRFHSEDLKVEWYKLATDFGFAVREHYSSFSLNGLDENFEPSLLHCPRNSSSNPTHHRTLGIPLRKSFCLKGMTNKKTQEP